MEFSRSKGFAIVSASNPSSPAKKPFTAEEGKIGYVHCCLPVIQSKKQIFLRPNHDWKFDRNVATTGSHAKSRA